MISIMKMLVKMISIMIDAGKDEKDRDDAAEDSNFGCPLSNPLCRNCTKSTSL